MLLDKLQEDDFAVLRGPFESGRQRPNSLGGMLAFSILLQLLMFVLTYVVAADSTYFPYADIVFVIHSMVTATLILLSIIFSFPKVYMSLQKTQYFIVILVSQNLFSLYLYISALFLLKSDVSGMDVTFDALFTFMYVTLVVGFLVFIITSFRFYVLLKKGFYRKGSSKDKLRSNFEGKINIPTVIVASMGLTYIIQFIAQNSYTLEVEVIGVIIIGPILFFTMLFVLPEQLVILYCKYRFESFNFDKDGNLKPMGSERKDD
ncbi:MULTISPECIES: hypothetical protein [Clostridia]|uniref:hypothetical protein n=1 Tax=Clostridia TaxID=186801 RepID=UPI000EA0FB85|nr:MULTISPECIES: hypothetical protein [Clostridia]NBJ70444.1 hypothetical protein [Roseburia sp. 1XD42-34]RKI76279.1 hypothetical protein D7V87_13920 [Clostridium sp. 1xD42-85]